MNPYAKLGTSGSLASTGVAVAGYVWWAVALVVLGGTLMALARFGPRIALDPVRTESGRRKLRLTVNGKARKDA